MALTKDVICDACNGIGGKKVGHAAIMYVYRKTVCTLYMYFDRSMEMYVRACTYKFTCVCIKYSCINLHTYLRVYCEHALLIFIS